MKLMPALHVCSAPLLGAALLFGPVAAATAQPAPSVQAGYSPALMESEQRISVFLGPRVHHFNYDPLHNSNADMIGVNWEYRPNWFVGAAFFSNSFDQDSQYVYIGRRWWLPALGSGAYFKLTGGILAGYREPFEDKIPFNNDGIALAAIPSLGYQWGRFHAQLNLLGNAGAMVTFGVDVLRW